MVEMLYRVTVGADEASTQNSLTSNGLVVELVCDLHADLIAGDPKVAACDVARKAIKRHFPKSEEPGYFFAESLDGVAASDFFGWSTLDCGCRAVITPNS
ncbi:MAG: hypothetical protein JO025_09290 [Verrucomicrobia bacterium]|nr:hypothetical protein [Verrucomicrobiota bacterium]